MTVPSSLRRLRLGVLLLAVAACDAPGGSLLPSGGLRGLVQQSTHQQPVAQTGGASVTPQRVVTIMGAAAGNGLAATGWFEWGTSPTLAGAASTPAQEANPGMTPLPISAQLTGLTPGATYYYRAVASNAEGTTRGAIASFTMGPPAAPQGFSATFRDSRYDLLATWQAPAMTSYYWLERRISPSAPWVRVTPEGTFHTTVYDLTVPVDSTRLVTHRVAACNTFGCSAWVEDTTTVTRLKPATNLTATALSGTSVQLTWQRGGDERGWAIERRTTGGEWTPVTSVEGTTYTNESLTPGTTYHFRVFAYTYQNRRSVPTAEASATPGASGPGAVPAAQTRGATVTPQRVVTLSGAAAGNGLPATAWFEWGTSPTLAGAASTPAQPANDATALTAFTAPLSGLTAGATYYYRAVASNAQGTTRGAIASFTMGPPPVPLGFSATFRAFRYDVLATWQAPIMASYYWLERRISPAAPWVRVTPEGTTQTSVYDLAVPVDSTRLVTHRVAACNTFGCSAWVEDTTTVTRLKPATSLTATALSGTSVRLSWQRGGDELGWAIERRTTGGAWTPVTSVEGTTYTNESLTPGTTYHYRVFAYTYQNRRSVPTAEASATPGASGPGAVPAAQTRGATVTPQRVVTLSGAAAGNGLPATAWFEWGTSPTLAGAASTPAQPANDATALTAFTAPLSGLTAGATYYFRAVASNAQGTTRGAIVPFTMGPPPVPQGFSATLRSSLHDVQASWQAPIMASYYWLERRISPAAPWVRVTPEGTTQTTVYDLAVPVDSTRLVTHRVAACNTFGCSAWVEDTTTVPALKPATNLTATVVSGTSVRLSWQRGGDERGFAIERRTAGGAWTAVTSTGATSYTNEYLTPGTTYHYRVFAYTYQNRRSVPTAEVSATP